jgi:GH15 family glucan-1,4-alpha-glucosidase
MARPIVLSNGSLHVGLNQYGLVHDFYYPYVGLENHAAGQDLRHKVGVWIDGTMSWLDDDTAWTFTFAYPHHSLIGHVTATHAVLGVRLEFDDCVDSALDALLRNIHIINLRDQPREIRLFTHQAFAIGDSRSNTDTAQYLPDSDAILHYRGRRAFVISGISDGRPFDQYTVGLFGIEGREGTYRDADDGELSFGTVEHGRVDSTLRFRLSIEAHGSTRVHYWIAAGTSLRAALAVHKQIRDSGLDALAHQTASWWHKWLQPALSVSERLPQDHRESFVRSAMIMKSQIDKRGAVIASTDTTMLNYSRDAYAYSWPRDGAYVVWPLMRMGYTEEALQFFRFCLRGLHPNGYLMHKYRADGALGSSWHPYLHGDVVAPPIQEDETALVVFVFIQYYMLHPDQALLDEFYESMIKPMANFMASYIDDVSQLPKPSYDLWEEVFMTTTYTTSVVYAALMAAADLAQEAHDEERAVAWRTAAEDIQQAAHKHLYNAERRAFYKGLTVQDGLILADSTIDMSSIFGVFMFGLFKTGSQELQDSITTARRTFDVTDQRLGLPRYENDNYQRADQTITGNWWFITSLWLAQYYTETSQPAEALQILDWVKVHMMTTGVLSEQINPLDDSLISVAPLTWSHAEYIATLLDTVTEAKQ